MALIQLRIVDTQLIKTAVSTCFYCDLQNLTFIFVILLVLYRYYCLYL